MLFFFKAKILFIFFLLLIFLLENFMFMSMKVEYFLFKFSSEQSLFLKLQTLDHMFFLTILIVSASIFFYSYFYMGNCNKMNNLFSWALLFFVVSMLILILSNNIIMVFLGWDGLGVSSFLLVIFYNNLFSLRSGMATFITNRLGDTFLIISLMFLYSKNMSSPMFSTLLHSKYMNLFIIFLVLSAMTKSAQIPFSAWLPAAMAAPTPVSSLVHSSTLVTAGIYLISQYFLNLSNLKYFSLMLSLLTILLSLISGMMAFYETDFKKMIAMSTLSQLGLLGFILFNFNSVLTIFHIISHALFKSLLFLTAGALIFFNIGNQDMRLKSNQKKNFFLLGFLVISTNLSLMGFPFTSGFFSKDMILMETYENTINMFLMILLLSACFMTVLYTINTIILTSNYFYNMSPSNNHNFSSILLLPFSILSISMMLFGKIFFFFLDNENYELSFFKKNIGMTLIMLGIIIISLLLKSNYLKKKIPLWSKKINEIFLSMTIMNWTSNNFATKNFNKWIFFFQMEALWWEMTGKTGAEKISNKSIPYMIFNTKSNTIFFFFSMMFLIFVFTFFL